MYIRNKNYNKKYLNFIYLFVWNQLLLVYNLFLNLQYSNVRNYCLSENSHDSQTQKNTKMVHGKVNFIFLVQFVIIKVQVSFGRLGEASNLKLILDIFWYFDILANELKCRRNVTPPMLSEYCEWSGRGIQIKKENRSALDNLFSNILFLSSYTIFRIPPFQWRWKNVWRCPFVH